MVRISYFLLSLKFQKKLLPHKEKRLSQRNQYDLIFPFFFFSHPKCKKKISYDPLPLDQILLDSLSKCNSMQFTFLWKVMIAVSSTLNEKDLFSKWVSSKFTMDFSSDEDSFEILSFFSKTDQQYTIKVAINLLSLTTVKIWEELINTNFYTCTFSRILIN